MEGAAVPSAAAASAAPTAPAAPDQPGTFGLQLAVFALMLAALVAAPFYFYPVLLAKILCFALFACAFNLLMGFVGLLSFGHAAFWGSAAYASAYAAAHWGWPPETCVVFGALVAAAFGYVIGRLAIARHGIYFAMITLAFAQMIFFFAVRAVSITGGEDGLQLGPNASRMFLGVFNLRDNLTLYWCTLGVFLFGFVAIYRVVHSPFGQILKAIRENEPRALSLGYRVSQYKVTAFVLSAGLAGLAGGMKVFVAGSASLTDVNWPMSGEVVLMALVGGMGTIFGPVAGAAVLVSIEEYLAVRAGAWINVIQGAVFVFCVLLFRRGIIGEIARVIRKPL